MIEAPYSVRRHIQTYTGVRGSDSEPLKVFTPDKEPELQAEQAA